MKRKMLPLLALALASVFAGQAFAQQASDSFNTPQGEVTVKTAPPPQVNAGPAPSFAQLAGGAKTIDQQAANAYPPLANDFAYADANRNGHITKAEYENWLKHNNGN